MTSNCAVKSLKSLLQPCGMTLILCRPMGMFSRVKGLVPANDNEHNAWMVLSWYGYIWYAKQNTSFPFTQSLLQAIARWSGLDLPEMNGSIATTRSVKSPGTTPVISTLPLEPVENNKT